MQEGIQFCVKRFLVTGSDVELAVRVDVCVCVCVCFMQGCGSWVVNKATQRQ
jgi:hypothetical protein